MLKETPDAAYFSTFTIKGMMRLRVLRMDVMKRKTIFRIIFINQHQNIYEIYARSVQQRDLMGFIVVEDLVFSETSSVVVDPGQERLKTEFQDVKCIYVPMHAVVRIDQVEKEGTAKIMAFSKESNMNIFPQTPVYNKSPEDVR